MILTITLNPAIDIRYNLEHFDIKDINRVIDYKKTAGGKGLNVSRIINKFEIEVLATGLIGGKLGELIEELLDKDNIKNDFEKIRGETRNCINITHENGNTEILENGPIIEKDEWESFKYRFKNLTKKYKYIIASGSLPNGLSINSYAQLIKISKSNGCYFFLDTSGQALSESLYSKPYFIKPNISELETILNKKLINIKDIINEAKKINELGVKIVAITLGKDGAIISTKNETLQAKIPNIKVLNTVGCGDSFVAGFVVGIYKKLSLEESFKIASASSISNAMLIDTGTIDIKTVNELINKINIIKF